MANNLTERYNYYKSEDSGKWGKATERALKAHYNMKDRVAKQGQVDFRRARVNYEIKTGAGELDSLLKSKIKYVLYVPVVAENVAEDRQEGFLIERTQFLEVLENVGLIRSKVSTAGTEKVTIQTFWNHKLNKPHGAKYYALLDALYENCIMTLKDFFEADFKLD